MRHVATVMKIMDLHTIANMVPMVSPHVNPYQPWCGGGLQYAMECLFIRCSAWEVV